MINYIDENEVQNSELLEELELINISINATYIVLLSVFINLKFLYSEKVRLIGEFNGTNSTNNLPNLDHLPLISKRLLIMALAISIKTNLEELNTLLSLDDTEENRRDIKNSKDSLLSSVLGYIAAGISHETILNTFIL